MLITTTRKLKTFFKTFKRTFKINYSDCLVCCEATGSYVYHLISITAIHSISTWIAHAEDIKRSLGMTRGKSDIVDAERIAEYALRFQDKARLWTPPRPLIERLKALLTCRDRLIAARITLEVPIREMEHFALKQTTEEVKNVCNGPINSLSKKIQLIDNKMEELIQSDPQLNELFSRLNSITGIGPITSMTFIVETNEFKDFANAKKLACHCGVAPFANSSGRKQGRARISHKANKKLKTLLDLCAKAAIISKGELRTYYERKIAEGKNKKLVRNAVRNKLVLRMFAVARDKTTYEKKFNRKVG